MQLTVIEHIDILELRLYSLGDVHIGSPDCDEELFQADVERIKNDPDARAIINGDMLDFVTKTSKGDSYKAKYSLAKQEELCEEWLYPIKDKILAINDGNHDALRTQEDNYPMRRVARHLNVPYTGGEMLLKLSVGHKIRNGKPVVYTVYATHGWAGGRLLGSKAINLGRLSEIVVADLYIINHTHQQMVFNKEIYAADLRNNNVYTIRQTFVNSGSYQRRGQYPIRKGMPAKVLGVPTIRLSGVSKRIIVEL